MVMNRSNRLSMKNRMLILSVSLALLAEPIQAQVSVSWGALISNGLGTSGGAELPIGDLIRIGTFTVTDAVIQQNQFNLNFLNASFIEFGRAAIGDDGSTPNALPPAHWNATATGSTDTLGLNGRRIYYWAFDAPSLGAATQQGIFTSSDSRWVFPPNSALPPNTITGLEDVPHDMSGIIVGGFGNGTSSATGFPLYNLTAVPEPSAYAAAFGVLCLASGVWLRRSKGRPNLARSPCD